MVSSKCDQYAKEAKKYHVAYEEAKAAGDKAAAKKYYEAYEVAMKKYKQCQGG